MCTENDGVGPDNPYGSEFPFFACNAMQAQCTLPRSPDRAVWHFSGLEGSCVGLGRGTLGCLSDKRVGSQRAEGTVTDT
jgi:hypothetical protein